jgi:hypothetical protein
MTSPEVRAVDGFVHLGLENNNRSGCGELIEQSTVKGVSYMSLRPSFCRGTNTHMRLTQQKVLPRSPSGLFGGRNLGTVKLSTKSQLFQCEEYSPGP